MKKYFKKIDELIKITFESTCIFNQVSEISWEKMSGMLNGIRKGSSLNAEFDSYADTLQTSSVSNISVICLILCSISEIKIDTLFVLDSKV